MTTPRTPQAVGSRPPFRRGGRRRRQCFCKESTVDYKDISSIRRFITDRGQIEAGKKSGNCAKCHRNLTIAIKRARHLALLPYAPGHTRVTGTVATNTKVSDDEETKAEESEETTEATVETTEAPRAEAAEQAESEETKETETTSEDVSSEESEEASDSESESDSDEQEK
ncbi:MAG TPA: 30S ribosomal protein S18 [Dehalococcoidia bacterium]|nr:30S ribosomal protein S18 [Chloroflexota bacterium]HCI85645.1 30S ribosomal protein S18 [Dehalococcoidia bacterium]|tara:strand:+ start:2648 stop:3157 length:510 start_codon:yes stop_codon:yes gene_type:complete